MVFQNPDGALNRRHSVRRIIGRAVQLLKGGKKNERDDRTRGLLEEIRMGAQHHNWKPRQLSGGLKQRVAIARAFAGAPAPVVCDEPTSALDVSVQAAIINLLAELQAEENVAYLFISHDLNVVRYIAERVAVMYLGRLMEVGTSDRVFAGPSHPYTEALLSASPELSGDKRIRLQGEIPEPSNPPSGCVFQTRCPCKIGEICETVEPHADPQSPRESGGFIEALREKVDLVVTPFFFVILASSVAAVWIYTDFDSTTARILSWNGLQQNIIDHLVMTFWSTLLVVLIAVPLGIFVTRPRFKRFSAPILTFANSGQAIPAFGHGSVRRGFRPRAANRDIRIHGVCPAARPSTRWSGFSRSTSLSSRPGVAWVFPNDRPCWISSCLWPCR